MTRSIKQAIVTPNVAIDKSKLLEEIALFNPDGTEYTGDGGVTLHADLTDTDTEGHPSTVISYEATTPADWSELPTEVNTALDFLAGTVAALPGSSGTPTIDGIPASPNADNHEFDSTIGSLTAVTGTAGTISLVSASGSGVYEIVDKTLYAFPNSESNVYLRMDRTIADGESVVGKFLCPSAVSFVGFVLNDANADPSTTTTSARISHWIDPGNARIITYDDGSFAGIKTLELFNAAIYLRIARVGTSYHTFFSLDGNTWQYVASVTSATAPDNIWVYFRRTGGATLPAGEVCGIDWLRFGSNQVHPWVYT